MAYRITQRDLEAVCQRINRTVNGREMNAYECDGETRDGEAHPRYHAVIDAYTLSGAYGGYSLHRIVNESGGVTDVFGAGHMPKRELYDRMHAFLRGFEIAEEARAAEQVSS